MGFILNMLTVILQCSCVVVLFFFLCLFSVEFLGFYVPGYCYVRTRKTKATRQ